MFMTTDQINGWFASNPNATDADIRRMMDTQAVDAWQLSKATGVPVEEITQRYNAVSTPSYSSPDPTGAYGVGFTTNVPAATTPPQTGMLSSSVSDAAVRTWLESNPKISDKEIRTMMDMYGVTPEQVARVTGHPLSMVQSRYNNALAPQAQTPVGSPSQPTKMPVSVSAPASGIVSMNTPGQDYNTQMQNYYKAYFGGASPDMGMLNTWYNTPYTPPVTGYVKPEPKTETETTTTKPQSNQWVNDGG